MIALPRIHRSCPLRPVGHSGQGSVISFYNEDFLAALPEIRRRTRRTVFVNCMTWLRQGEGGHEPGRHLLSSTRTKVQQSMIHRLTAPHPGASASRLSKPPYSRRRFSYSRVVSSNLIVPHSGHKKSLPFLADRLFWVERMMRFELTTSTLARLRSTPELHPL